MLLDQYGESITIDGVTFTVGGRVHSRENDDYGGLDGVINEIRTGADKETENAGADIYCTFDVPDDPQAVAELEERFSDLFDEPKTIDDIGLDYIIMAPDMLDVLDAEQAQTDNPQPGFSM